MADFHMHVLLIDDVLNTLGSSLDRGLAKLGSQGPDMFFFNIRSKAHDTSVMLANQMHNLNINAQLIYLTNYVKRNPSDNVRAFYVGYLSHYALDTIIHPYIFHRSGFYDPKDISSKSHRGLHLRFERRVDIQYVKDVLHQNPKRYPVCDLSYVTQEIPDDVLAMMDGLAKDVYDIEGASQFYEEGYQTIRGVCRKLVRDRYGIKRHFVKLLDLFPRKTPIYLSDISYANPIKGIDYLNINHQPWLHPVTKKMSKESVLDLYQKAKSRTLELIEKTSLYIDQNQKISLETLFGNRSFDTGIDVQRPQTMRYFNLFNQKK